MTVTLSQFISANRDEILEEWEEFASKIPAAEGMNTKALRDHAALMLDTIAADLAQPQSAREQEAKSKGQSEPVDSVSDTAAEEHGSARQAEGFSLSELLSEFRALRASVIRLWTRTLVSIDQSSMEDLTRFNEAIDQALAESGARYSVHLDRSREIFLGVLGHDLRSPLGAVMNSADYLLRTGDLSGPQLKATATIVSSGRRIRDMLSDLLDVTRTRLGESLPIEPRPVGLRELCQEVVEQTRAYHPDHDVKLTAKGLLEGTWDESRLAQMLGNLVENAIHHGAPDGPVTISVRDDGEQVKLSVHNEGGFIPTAVQKQLFEPLTRAQGAPRSPRRDDSLGLGLYIARVIVEAHQGSIEVHSTKTAGTTFTVYLPRTPPSFTAGSGP